MKNLYAHSRRHQQNKWGGWLLAGFLFFFLVSAVYTGYLAYHAVQNYVQKAPSLPSLNAFLPPRSAQAAASEQRTAAVSGTTKQAAGNNATNQELKQILSLPQWNKKDRITILLLGVDQRPGDKSVPRTDTMIVLTMDPNSGHLGMISIPRDMWVHIPAYDLSAKINTAYQMGEKRHYPGGGAALVKKTVSDLIGYPIHYYFMVNFDGFEQMIDQIGGIDVNVPYAIDDTKYPDNNYGVIHIHFNAGEQHLNGDLALKYARTRHQDSDYGRARRQQQVILAVKNKVLQRQMIPSLMLKLPQLLNTLQGAIHTDLPLDKMMALAEMLQNADVKHVDQLVLDNHYGTESYSEGGAWILVPDMAKIRPAVDRIFGATDNVPGDKTHAATATPPTKLNRALLAPTATPDILAQLRSEKARVVIVDGSNRPAIVARLAQQLTLLGFDVVQFGSGEEKNVMTSRLIVYHYKPASRAFLKEQLHLSKENVREGSASNLPLDFRLIIGADFQSLKLTAP